MTQKGKAFDDFEGAVPLFPLKKHSYAKFGYLGSISGSLEVLRLAPRGDIVMMQPLRRMVGYDDLEYSMFDSFKGAFPPFSHEKHG